jgi:hypothetical protein
VHGLPLRDLYAMNHCMTRRRSHRDGLFAVPHRLCIRNAWVKSNVMGAILSVCQLLISWEVSRSEALHRTAFRRLLVTPRYIKKRAMRHGWMLQKLARPKKLTVTVFLHDRFKLSTRQKLYLVSMNSLFLVARRAIQAKFGGKDDSLYIGRTYP